jgi:hypothetical protein
MGWEQLPKRWLLKQTSNLRTKHLDETLTLQIQYKLPSDNL